MRPRIRTKARKDLVFTSSARLARFLVELGNSKSGRPEGTLELFGSVVVADG